MAKILRLVTVFAFFSFALSAHARNDSCQNEMTLEGVNNAAAIAAVGPGFTVRFPDEKAFDIESLLPDVGANAAFLIKGNKVLLVSKSTPEQIEAYHTGYRPLVERHIPVPRMFGANPRLWVIREVIDIEFTLLDVVSKGSSISAEKFEQLREEFGNFAFKFHGFDKVAGLNLKNIAYVRNRGWMMVNWLDSHKVGYKLNPFRDVFGLNSENSLIDDRLLALRQTAAGAIAAGRGHEISRYCD